MCYIIRVRTDVWTTQIKNIWNIEVKIKSQGLKVVYNSQIFIVRIVDNILQIHGP